MTLPPGFSLNRVLKASDFGVLTPEIERQYGSQKTKYRKHWETAMALETARRYAIPLQGWPTLKHRKALGLGAGEELTSFALTPLFWQVHATDLYLDSGVWSDVANAGMMIDPGTVLAKNPERVAGVAMERLIVQHMDMTRLRYEADTFQFVYSSGSIEHIAGQSGDVDYSDLRPYIRCLEEVNRVLAPNGVVSISTEYCFDAPSGQGWPGVKTFNRAEIVAVIDQAGFKMVDEPSWMTDAEAMSTRLGLGEHVKAYREGRERPSDLVLIQSGITFSSIHLCLVKQTGITDAMWERIKNQAFASSNRDPGPRFPGAPGSKASSGGEAQPEPQPEPQPDHDKTPGWADADLKNRIIEDWQRKADANPDYPRGTLPPTPSST